MSQKIIIDNVGRVKAYYYKGESDKVLLSCIKALQAVVKSYTQVPVSMRGSLREAVQFVASDKAIMKYTKKPISYTPGQEKPLLKQLEDIYEVMVGSLGKESKEDARKRKLALDKTYNLGLRLLQANKISEADQAFQQCVKLYKSEKKLFVMIAKALMEAKEYVRASTYLKKAKEIFPDSEEISELIKEMNENIKK